MLVRFGLEDEGLQPVTFAALRYGLAAIVLVGWVIARESRHRHRYQVGRGMVIQVVLLGLLLYSLTQGAIFVALDHQPAASTSLLLSLTPLLVTAGAAVSLAEVPTRPQLAGVLLVAAGAWAYVAGDLGWTQAGMIAATVALLANVVATLLGRSINRSGRLPASVVTASSMGVGAATLVFIGVGYEGIPHITLQGWLIIAWLAVVNTAFAFTLWNLSLQRLSAVESASINNTMLIQVAVLAWLLLGEAPGALGLLGIGLVSGGVYLVQAARRRPGSAAGTAAADGAVGTGG